jgi:hypothetical protein
LQYSIDKNDAAQRAQFTAHPSAIGTKYNHRVYGDCSIQAQRPIFSRGELLPEPYIEVQLVSADVSFWTGACYLNTMKRTQARQL